MLQRQFSLVLAVVTAFLSLSRGAVDPALAADEDMLRLPHVTANRVAKRVEIDAVTTDVKKGDILEFLLISKPSGHTYESLAVSDAKPSDVKKALEFIGMTAGHGVDPAKLRFWPKGERAIVSVLLNNAAAGTKPTRVEKLVLNERAKAASIPESGFVFIGSRMIEDRENPGTPAFAADVREPNSIIANYNENESIFDVPRVAPQNDVYRTQVANPDAHVAAIQACAKLIEEVNEVVANPMNVLDIGGGFPVDYEQSGMDVDAFFAPITRALSELPPELNIIAEPGRFLVAPAVTGVATISGKARRGDYQWYYLDDGIYGSYSGQLFDHVLYPLQITRDDEQREASILAGPTCDSIDIIAEDIMLPALQEGDLVIGHMMGAYTHATATRFNSLTGAKVILVD